MTTKSSSTIIARGTSNAAFTQLTANAATTRSGTTATLTMASTATLATNDKCLIQGHDLEEYNGVFTITVASGTTITYTIKQDPGANSSVTNATVDKVTMGTALDVSTVDSGEVVITIQNGATGPTVAAEVWEGVAIANNEYDYIWRPMFTGTTTAKDNITRMMTIPQGRMYVNYVVGRNTGQAVDCFALATKATV